jgi:hypothetical protein
VRKSSVSSRQSSALAAACLLLAFSTARPVHAQFDNIPPAGADPYVLLDYGKLMLEDGRVEKAYEWIAQIPLGQAEGYVDEELLIQRLLISGAFVRSATYLAGQVRHYKLDGPYLSWLGQERERYLTDYCDTAQLYLDATGDGYECGFIRFRLPQVTESHMQDLELYAAGEMLDSAAKNWAEGRDTLGRGLLIAQARAAIVLGAAVHYDLPDASSTLKGLARRLHAGVPIYPALLFDWLAQNAADSAFGPDRLARTALSLDARLLSLPGGETTVKIKQRAGARAKLPALLAASRGETAPEIVASAPADTASPRAAAGPSASLKPADPAPQADAEAPPQDGGEKRDEPGAEAEDAKDAQNESADGEGDSAAKKDPPRKKKPRGRPIPRRPRGLHL